VATKGYFVNAILNLIIMAVCLGFMFMQPIKYTYAEVDRTPGYNPESDYLVSVLRGWQIESIKVQPNYFAGLTGALVISTIGFAFSISQWDRGQNEAKRAAQGGQQTENDSPAAF
jgi:hypothetical protein